MNTRNKVAAILQGYAWFNAFGGLILALIMSDSFIDGTTIFISFLLIIIASFVIYAFGEVIQLLHDIKENTAGKGLALRNDVEDIEANLPEI